MDSANKADTLQDSTDSVTPVPESEKAADVSICKVFSGSQTVSNYIV